MSGDSDPSRVPFTRRGYLGIVGSATAAVAAGATQRGRASDTGYGTSGYGTDAYGGSESTGSSLGVSTIGSTDVDTASATVLGELTGMADADSASVYFEWGPSNESITGKTTEETVESTGQFEATLSELSSDTDYEFRAVAAADGTVVTGTTRSFRTASEERTEGTPNVEYLTGVDVSNHRNPHVDAELEWEATIDESELYAAVLTLSDQSGVLESWQYDLSGRTAEATETKRLPHRADEKDTEYTVDLIVYSYYGNTDERTTTFTAQ